MKLKNITTLGTILLLCSFLLTACHQINKNTADQTTPVGETTAEQDMAEPQPTFSTSTQVDDLDKEVTEFEIPAEDYSDL